MIVTDPVATVHVGWVAVSTGADGVNGCAFSVIVETAEIHPSEFFAVTVCVDPAANPEYTNVAEYGLVSKL